MTDCLVRILQRCPFWLLLFYAIPGCRAQRPDMAGEAARLTGLDNAIVFRSSAEPLAAPVIVGGLPPSQAVGLACAHDPRIQSSLAKVRVAEAEANQARLLPNPILGIDIRFPAPNST